MINCSNREYILWGGQLVFNQKSHTSKVPSISHLRLEALLIRIMIIMLVTIVVFKRSGWPKYFLMYFPLLYKKAMRNYYGLRDGFVGVLVNV